MIADRQNLNIRN